VCSNRFGLLVGAQVEPFSVKHEYEAPWDPVKPSLETCHPGRMQYVTHGLAPQVCVLPLCVATLPLNPALVARVCGSVVLVVVVCTRSLTRGRVRGGAADGGVGRGGDFLLRRGVQDVQHPVSGLQGPRCVCGSMHGPMSPAVRIESSLREESTCHVRRWASRWDTYLLMMDDQIHWFSIVNSLMIVLFLSGMVAMIMLVRARPSLAPHTAAASWWTIACSPSG
jgi:hypothetical protein